MLSENGEPIVRLEPAPRAPSRRVDAQAVGGQAVGGSPVGASAGATPKKRDAQASTAGGKARLIAEARIKGYEGDACPECQQFTMVRNGTCLKCMSCGATSGCS